jgi:hypothetical protein
LVSVSNLIVLVSDLFVLVLDLFVSVSNLIVLVSDLFVLVSDLLVSVSDIFVLVSDMFCFLFVSTQKYLFGSDLLYVYADLSKQKILKALLFRCFPISNYSLYKFS